jgi:dolichol-phosphate mannosyltransferase
MQDKNYNHIEISIVVPIYNERETLPRLYQEIKKSLMDDLGNYEIIFVDDYSDDNSLEFIKKLKEQDGKVEYLSFSRNFGHQTAISAGLNVVKGKFVVVMDGDLQDPPSLIPHFYRKMREGFEVVYGVRTKRKENIFKRICYKGFYYIVNKMSTFYIPRDSGDFCIMSRKVVNYINQLPEKERFVRGLRAWVGFKQVGIHYERGGRYQGESKYSFIKLLELAFNGIVSFSDIPLKAIIYLGFAVTLLGVCGILILLGLLLFTNVHIEARGWTSMLLIILLLSGIQISILGIVGFYITKIFIETKRRLPYVIRDSSIKDIRTKQFEYYTDY